MRGAKIWLGFIAISFSGLVQAIDRDEGKLGQAMRKTSEPSAFPGNLYTNVELRHHLNTYYDETDLRTEQEPSMHARAAFGGIFRDGLIDAYATFGVIKMANTQEVVQRRPEFEVDIFPVYATYGKIIQYNIVQMPYKEDSKIADDNEPVQHGTTYTFGVAPSVFLPTEVNGSKLKVAVGVDYWTELFSRKQPRDRSEHEIHSKEKKETSLRGEDEGKEDSAMHHYTEYMLGGSISPAWARSLEIDLSAFYDVDFLPQYEEGADGYRYVAEKSSHYRLRLQYDLSDRLSFVNDFYHFHYGFFEQKIYGDERRFRNIARLTYRL